MNTTYRPSKNLLDREFQVDNHKPDIADNIITVGGLLVIALVVLGIVIASLV